MTISAWDIYWITRLDNLQLVLILGLAVSLCISALTLIESDSVEDFVKPACKYFLPVAAACAMGLVFVPSTKSAAAMYVVPAIVNSEAVQKIPAELTALAKDWLKDLHKDTK